MNTMCQLITDLINLFLIDKGLTNYINKFTIRMQQPITQEELDRRENMRNRVGVVNDIMSQINQVVTDEILQAKIVKALLSTSIADPEVISLMQEQIDMLEEAKEDGEEIDNKKDKPVEPPAPEINLPTPIGPSNDFEEPEPFEEPEEIEEPGNETIEPVETETEDSYLPNGNELGVDLTGGEI